MQTLAKTLHSWRGEIAAMWRFTKNNGITEGFHRKMKLIQRRAYGFRNFQNYRLRVIAACGSSLRSPPEPTTQFKLQLTTHPESELPRKCTALESNQEPSD
jgi:hypothetical protein